jgi:hypothetical protein
MVSSNSLTAWTVPFAAWPRAKYGLRDMNSDQFPLDRVGPSAPIGDGSQPVSAVQGYQHEVVEMHQHSHQVAVSC